MLFQWVHCCGKEPRSFITVRKSISGQEPFPPFFFSTDLHWSQKWSKSVPKWLNLANWLKIWSPELQLFRLKSFGRDVLVLPSKKIPHRGNLERLQFHRGIVWKNWRNLMAGCIFGFFLIGHREKVWGNFCNAVGGYPLKIDILEWGPKNWGNFLNGTAFATYLPTTKKHFL